MAYQLLQGVTVTPKGNYNLSRFSKSLVGSSWPTSFAFGGWIYNATSDIGFSSQPSEIRLSIVLEVTDREQKYAFFDINDDDMRCDAGDGGNENWFDVDFNGVSFSNFLLYSYDIAIENNTKILTVVLRDYSTILDKIYVGLLKRQGDKYVHTASATLSFPVRCADCQLNGDSIVMNSSAQRDLAYGSYVGINGGVYDNFGKTTVSTNVYDSWESLFAAPPTMPYFDLNGGYLILGTEQATEEKCGDLAPMTYNFNQLLASLRLRGLKFEGAFPKAMTDSDFVYQQNYVGTLREVLQQWCSDLGYDFYCQGKTFIGINLNRALDIKNVVDIADPTTDLGKEFALNKNAAILSYKQSSSLTNTFKQAVVTANNRPRNFKTHSKSLKRYVGILPLHPIDFNRHSVLPVIRYDAFGTWFYDVAWANNFEPATFERTLILPELDGRMYGDIDTAIALGHYSDTLRDLYCADLALHGTTKSIREAHFRALGMVPLVEVTEANCPEAKALAIERAIPEQDDEISNICRDQRFYRVFIGYYYSQFKDDIVEWEHLAADNMYKYGIVVKGLLNRYPYMPANHLVDMSPKEGFYGEKGTSLLRTQHQIEPSAQQYYSMRMAPFKDLILYSGLYTPVGAGMPLNIYDYSGVFPTGLFYANLANEWGTSKEDFQRKMSWYLDDPCVKEFGSNNLPFTDMVNNIPKRIQDWKLDTFRPWVTADLEGMWEFMAVLLQNLPQITDYDRTVDIYYDTHYTLAKQCSKLHVMVIPDTRIHPNIGLRFTPQGTRYINGVMLQNYMDRLRESERRRVETKTPSECDLSLLQEMCRNLLSGEFRTGPTGDPRFACLIDEDKYNWLEDGFTFAYLTQPNSRGLTVSVAKNPIRGVLYDALARASNACDYNGDIYYADVTSNMLQNESTWTNYTIVYPITTNCVGGYGGASGMYYRGVLTSDVDVENRTPEMVEIFGEPVASTNNRTTSVKLINNNVDPDLQPQLDPYTSRFLSYMTVLTGNGSIITSVEQYHEMVKKLNDYQLTSPMKSVEVSLAGTPNYFGSFKQYLTPEFGLQRMSMSVSDNGVTTSLSFSDRPKVLPKQESILNKIGPRIIR